MKPRPASVPARPSNLSRWFETSLGAFFGVALLKFGNPVIMDKYADWPKDILEWILNPWPTSIARAILLALSLFGIVVIRRVRGIPKLLLLLPALWLLWQVVSCTTSVAQPLSEATVIHFLGCAASFYLGFFCLGSSAQIRGFCLGLAIGFLLVLFSGFEQHFGGLAESQKYWMTYVYPTLKEIPPGFMKKMASTRIFATLFYPNTLAGAILLVLPPVLGAVWEARERLTRSARIFLMSLFTLAASACLFWSGSKAGWLIFLLLGACFLLAQPFSKRLKMMLVIAVLLFGLAGFAVKYRSFFQKGATSVVARFDYWQAAVSTALDKPLLGNGPGAFGKAYALRKRPESEMAQLAHNDYLQQASDSGIPGFLFFTSFVLWGMARCFKNIRLHSSGGWLRFAVWLGLLGWAVQSTMEFGLYIPAIGWLAFALMGWLLAQTPAADSNPHA